MTRGIRNCNPGNIRHVKGTVWLGQAPFQNDPEFVVFTDPVYGIRAIARVMLAYEKEGLKTIQAAVDRWAPPNENNSSAYVAAVCQSCGIAPTIPVELSSILPSLVKAIIFHENGMQPYAETVILEGVNLACQ